MSEIVFEQENSTQRSTGISTAGKFLLGITGGFALGLSVICIPFVSPAFRRFCLPYIPATETQLHNLSLALRGRRGKLLDLGSGDGRIVLKSAQNGSFTECHGVELNIWLVLYAKIEAWRQGLGAKVQFYRRDLWEYHVDSYENIVIFGVEQMMKDLEKKFDAECRKDCHVVACRFPLPNRKPARTIGHGIDAVWVYDFQQKSKSQ